MSRYSRLQDFQPTEEELAAQRKAAQAPGEDTAWGAGIGSTLGAIAGGLLSIPSFGTLAPILIPAGAAAGGGIGSAIGGSVGNSDAQKAGAVVDAAELERQKKLQEFKMRQAALDDLEQTA